MLGHPDLWIGVRVVFLRCPILSCRGAWKKGKGAPTLPLTSSSQRQAQPAPGPQGNLTPPALWGQASGRRGARLHGFVPTPPSDGRELLYRPRSPVVPCSQ